MRTSFFLFFAFALISLPGCYSARAIKVFPGKGGVVEVNPGFKSLTDPEVQAAAMKVMEANCGFGRVKVIEEGYVKVGEKTETTGEEQTTKHESWRSKTKSTQGQVKTVDINSWRITYECLGNASP